MSIGKRKPGLRLVNKVPSQEGGISTEVVASPKNENTVLPTSPAAEEAATPTGGTP